MTFADHHSGLLALRRRPLAANSTQPVAVVIRRKGYTQILMTKTVFIASAEPHSGKSLIALGLVDMLLGKAQKIGYFKPIINATETKKKDVHIDTVLSYFNLPVAYE